ncbi:RcpC/CpaB family pilus assembly protein [Streptomyces maoxianensis]|uniref:RcpC/CpaB family pilus assembly protein n=1 Tax=Streptomyces maoxianensis TaxID=1459942 RepID=A0ABV9G4N4_9ACTN
MSLLPPSVPPSVPPPVPSSLPPSPAPEPLGVPPFAPLRVRGGAHRLRRAMRRRRRALAAGLAMTAALAASGARGADGSGAEALAAAPQRERRPAAEMVSAPVRIADAATVRLLRRGDRVDVIAAANSPAGQGSEARVVASGVRVDEVPGPGEPSTEGSSPDSGALVVLSVPRATAAALVGAGATSRLAVTVC